jgi:glyoxylase-like metal-dependent hydrolase (beta-lactamase superfamily II)
MTMMIADHWFDRKRIDDDITMLWEPHVVPLLRCNIWHIRGRDRDLLIDTGMGIGSLKEAARDLLQKAVTAVATHVHADHIGGHHEFDDCIIHHSEAVGLRHATGDYTLMGDDFDPTDLSGRSAPGYEPTIGPMITAIPYAGYDLRSFRVHPASVTRTVEEGDVVDLGDRSFEVLHLPGHSRGCIGLWEKSTGILFSGDSVYDGPLLDELPGSNIPDYVRTMERLRDLPVRVVHAGHDPSFGRERLIELVDAYLKRRELAS